MDIVEKYLNEANTNFKSAEEAYNNRYSNIQKLIKQLSTNLKKHESKFKKSGKTDWGYAGDLGKIEQDLIEVNEFMG